MTLKDNKETIKIMNDFAKDLINIIEKSKKPELTFKSRNKKNLIFDKKTGYLNLGNEMEKRAYLNVSQSKKFMQTLLVMKELMEALDVDMPLSIRGLFYKLKYNLNENIDEKIFDEQNESNNVASDIELLLDRTREQLSLTALKKGSVIGDVVVKEYVGEDLSKINWNEMGSSGYGIPSNPDRLEFVKVSPDIKYVLVVEKEALFNILNRKHFQKTDHCIVMTTQGQGSQGARRLIHILNEKFKLPVYVLNDDDCYGLLIWLTVKNGSQNIAWKSKYIATPDAKYIGLMPSDVEKYKYLKNLSIKEDENDLQKLKNMMEYLHVKDNKKLVKELQLMYDTGIKVESDALQAISFDNLVEYIRTKIKNKDWIE